MPGLRNRYLLLSIILWMLFWIVPWANWLDDLPWVRLGLSLLFFAIPGIVISMLLAGANFGLLRHFISGLALSVLIISILGILGRLLNLPFPFIKTAFALLGLVILVLLLRKPERQFYKPKSSLSATSLFILLVLIVFGIVINLLSRTTGDDQTYLAYLTSWQHATPLNLQEVFYGSGYMDSIRFWLAVFPMSLALLAEMSNLSGLLLIGFYLEPFLIVIAILVAYDLYEYVLRSELLAIASVVLQFTFLFLLRGYQQPGLTFFNRLSEDKVFGAFILFPVFFLAACFLLEKFNKQSMAFFLLTGMSLALTHPVILAYGDFIISVYTVIVMGLKKEYKQAGIMLLLLIVIILPVGLLRFIHVSSASTIPYDLDSALAIGAGIETRIKYLAGTPFYGFNLDRIRIQFQVDIPKGWLESIMSYSYIWIVGIGFLWSIVNIKKYIFSPFIAASASLVLLSAIPYTGWLIGYFVSARMLWRIPWLVPIGLIAVVLLSELLRFIITRLPVHLVTRIMPERVTFGLVIGIGSILIAYSSLNIYKADWKALAGINEYYNTLKSLSALGNDLETKIEQPSVFLTPTQSSNELTGLFTQSLMDYLPGISSKSKVAIFRGSRAPYIKNPEKLPLVFSSDKSVSYRQRINILKNNHIQYVLIDDRALSEYYSGAPQFFDIDTIGNYWLLQLHEERSP